MVVAVDVLVPAVADDGWPFLSNGGNGIKLGFTSCKDTVSLGDDDVGVTRRGGRTAGVRLLMDPPTKFILMAASSLCSEGPPAEILALFA